MRMAKPAKTKAMCSGCHNNFYNDNNPHGVKECWTYKSAKVIKRRAVHRDERPPWKGTPRWMFDCFNEPGWWYVDPKVTC